MNKKKILLASLLLSFYSIGYSEDLKGTFFLETNYLNLKNNNKNSNNGIFKYNTGKEVSPPNQTSPSKPENWVNIWKNKKAIINTKYYEENSIINVDNSSVGLLATGENVKIVNNGNINLNKDGVGMAVNNNASMENGVSGNINLNKNNEIGMLSTPLTTGINKGVINLSGGNNYTQSGMAAKDGGTSINNGEILLNSNSSYGMLANSNTTTKLSDQQTSIKNNNKILIDNSFAGIGMESREDLSVGVNTGDISIKNSTSSRGMVSAKGAKSINEGNISIINSTGSFGMNIGDGDSATDQQTSIINNKTIATDSASLNSVGMRVFKEDGYNMDKGLGENYGNLNINGKNNIGMLANGINTEVINNKNILLSENHNIGIKSHLSGSNGINNGNITIKENTNSSFGMVTFSGGSITNNGNIVINSSSSYINVGMQTVDGVALNNNEINLNNKNQVGMNAVGTGVADNKGIINMAKSKGSSFGMTVRQGATIINSNKINLLGTGTAMSSELSSDTNVTLINKGDILLKTNSSSGMVTYKNSNITNEGKIDITGDWNTAINAKSNSIVKLAKGSIITLTGNHNTGILLSNAKLINNGDIIISGNGNIGVSAANNSNVTNAGVINISSGDNNIGISIQKGSTLSNIGTILIKGEDVTDNPGAGRTDKNIGIYNLGTIINSGKIIASKEFNSNNIGSGSLIMDKNSTLEAKKISGDIKLSSNITTGSLKDEYSTYKMFKTDDMKANLISDSLLFNIKLNNNNQYYDASLVRKNFNEIIDDSNLANYLEKNYIADGNLNKISLYDKFKMASSNQQLNSLLDDTFGRMVFPTLQKQTFEMMRLNNEILKSNISKEAIKEEFKYIVGGAYNKIDSDSSKNVEGYISSLKNIWIGGEKRVTDTIKTGLILSIGDYNSNFTKNSHREDRILQGTFFTNYDNKNLNIRMFATFGGTKTDLDRESKSYHKKLDSNFDSRYFVLSNEISKTFNFRDNSYIIPRVNLNLYRLKQDEIRETNGQYAAEIGKIKSIIVEPGVGITLGKNILLNTGYNLKPELEFNYFYKTGNLKNNLEGKIKSISDDRFTLNGYQFERNSGDGKLKISLEKENWNIYASYKLLFEDKVSSITTFGINYKFN